MCLFAIVQGYALGDTPRGSFLLDFATYARFFVGIPILVIADGLIGARLTLRACSSCAMVSFNRRTILPSNGRLRASRNGASPWWRRSSSSPSRLRGVEAHLSKARAGWAWSVGSPSSSRRDTPSLLSRRALEPPCCRAGASFLWYRWLWRIVIWTLFLRDVARLDLRLVPTHADGAGGLGFLEIAHTSFGILAFGVGSVLSAQAAFQIVYEGARIDVFQTPVIVVLVVMQVLFLGPLLIFSRLWPRPGGMPWSYGSLVVRYNRGFQEKWIDSRDTAGRATVGQFRHSVPGGSG